jgi:uncharacterized protein YjbI with pentapeptide repeats
MPAPIVAYWNARLAYWEAIPDDVRITLGLAVLAALLLAIAIWWLWWRLPKREVARLALKIRDPKARADVEDNYRKTVGQALGGIVVLLGAGTAYLQFSQQQQASHDLLISNQVSKGFEQLGSEKVVVRLGGIYALEGVMNASDQYHRPVLEALTAFVREGTRANTTPTPTPTPTLPTDIQAALTVIGRRSAYVNDQIDLADARLAGADLSSAALSGAALFGADLTHATLTDAILSDATLSGATLFSANLTSAGLPDVNLTRANLTHANLTAANLFGANLTHANLTGANLTGANLTGASLDGQQQLDEACGSDAVLPTGLTLKPCPPQP